MEQHEQTGHTKFPAFPFTPYSIQVDFMNSLYESLNRGGISMLESPTGTGKTLSIICSSLQWLVDRRQHEREEQQPKNGSASEEPDNEPDWLKSYTVQNCSRGDSGGRKSERKMKPANPKENGIYPFYSLNKDENLDAVGQFDGTTEKDNIAEVLDCEFLLEDYESEDEGGTLLAARHKRKVSVSSGSSSSDDSEQVTEDDDEKHKMKVYFCSRTHSQLSQFVKELRKTVFASQLNVICIGSRKLFCINEDVRKIGSASGINERCLELQNKTKSKVSKAKSANYGRRIYRTNASGCPMLRKHKLQKSFRNDVLETDALDIEDLVDLGRNLGTCPYYGSRSMLSVSDLVILPYQSLLSKPARESLGLDLKGNIVIIDEAHNLADSLISMYNAKVTTSQLQYVDSCLKKYLERFRNLLGAGNRRYIQTLLIITGAFIHFLLARKSDSSSTINEFLFTINIDNINLVKLVNYIKDSRVIYKVSGYADNLLPSETPSGEGSLSSFQALVELLLTLTNSDSDGRIIISRTSSPPYLKYVMLMGEKIFSQIADEAHAVVLAGGTLQPVEEMKERLFPCVTADRLSFFSCGHIIPSDSILPLVVTRSPSGHLFDFSYASRSSMAEELGFLICNLVSVVPEGIVVFFSSFDYEAQVYNSWTNSGILQRILKKKCMFREPRKSSNIECVLKEYRDSVSAGAVFMAVVGGKVSEGINFSDGMGRCIVMAGLPYPSPSDIELIERIKYLERCQGDVPQFDGDVQSGIRVLRSCKGRGRAYYENLCMKAVNQSIGRAIRHAEDYAAVLLVDHRYVSEPSMQNSHPIAKLPEWIKSRISTTTRYGDVHRQLHQFFRYNAQRGLV